MGISNAKKFELALIEACDKHIATGGTIISGSFTGRTMNYCPITALVGINSQSRLADAMIKSGTKIKSDQYWAFIYSFDGMKFKKYQINAPEFDKLGKKLRKKYILKK